MSVRQLCTIGFCLVLLCVLSVPSAVADEWNQATKLTFSEPIEIPGSVLPAGTYWFTLMNDDSDRNVVQIWGADRMHLLATVLAIPDYRLQPTGKTVIKFAERPHDQPEALRAWFYPGDNYGHEFVYPKAKAVQLAKANNTPVPSMPNELAANTTKPATTTQEPHVVEMKQAPLKAQQPTEEEVEIAQVFLTKAAPQPSLPEKLPTTASSLPLVGLLGLFSLASGGLLWLLNTRRKETE